MVLNDKQKIEINKCANEIREIAHYLMIEYDRALRSEEFYPVAAAIWLKQQIQS